MTRRLCSPVLGFACALLAGCSGSRGGEAPSPDAAIAVHDGGHTSDAATSPKHDAAKDSAAQDSGHASDTGARDTGVHDAGARDTGHADSASTPEAAVPDAGPSCGGAGTWSLVWSDEFNGADGRGIDPTKWTAQTGGSGWGNQEREYYTDDLANAEESGGNLVITATTDGASAYSCWYGECSYTSARLQTLGLFSQEYGRFEARIKIPSGQGLWPAFWMLGNDIDTVSWPTCGEIDVMENIGKEPATVHGSMHGPSDAGATNVTAGLSLDGGAFSDDFHVYAIEWETNVVRFYVDDTLYETVTPASDPAGATWVFDQPFFLLLNVAVGGSWPGDPDGTTVFPQTMLVDYVRVCQ